MSDSDVVFALRVLGTEWYGNLQTKPNVARVRLARLGPELVGDLRGVVPRVVPGFNSTYQWFCLFVKDF